ncbi:P-loop containing nucleoside triphosphate hydrolase protein [Roridomyces roridus]|uniref:P-loop containing nucleoside triphosphate hydrolase protein n=1 Tax=Roridomyces roridus TaxID=1738132 RepID=A0AAD7FKE8_9AGAR|nr:P-loop containing nucleoside triphosphate hydrolase protein [Roridomyces roridus]
MSQRSRQTEGSSSFPRRRWSLKIRTNLPAPDPDSWLWTSLLAARTISAAAESFPYLKGAISIVVVLLETVETVKKNREDLRELCGTVMEVITIVQEQQELHGKAVAVRFKALCDELEECLHGVLSAVKELQKKPEGLRGRFKEIIRGNHTADLILSYEKKIRHLRSNFLLTATMDTNLQVQKVLTVISPVEGVFELPNNVTRNCPLPSRLFCGRQYILEKMQKYFLQDGLQKQKVFLLHGLGGAGKTQVALKFVQDAASLFSPSFSDVFLLDCSTVETIQSGFKEIAIAKNIGASQAATMKWLSTQTHVDWLLVFDNTDDPNINLNNFLPHCNHGNILITSRNPGLSVYAGEQYQVADMQEDEAMELLLESAAQESTPATRQLATEIVKVLCYLPLAITQAGAFIAKSGSISSYLQLYRENQKRLLSEKPGQTHDNYAWTVYTTWQMSFEKLSPGAKALLELCSMLHHQGISEQIFSKAATYDSWEAIKFTDISNELRAYSLINSHVDTDSFSIHPLVHSWLRSQLCDEASTQTCVISIMGMCLSSSPRDELEVSVLSLMPHIEALLQGQAVVDPDFNAHYANAYRFSGRYKQAEQLHLVALEKKRATLGKNHPETLNNMRDLATVYHHWGQFSEAATIQSTVLQSQKLTLGVDDVDTLKTMSNVAVTYNELGKFEEAEYLATVVLEKYRKIYGDDSSQTLFSMMNLGWMLHSLGKLVEAEAIQISAIQGQKRLLGEDHPDTVYTMGNLGSTYRSLGKLKEAEELETLVLEKQKKIYGLNHQDTLWTMGNLALTYQEKGQLQLAEQIQLAVLERRRTHLGEEHPETKRAVVDLESTQKSLAKMNLKEPSK